MAQGQVAHDGSNARGLGSTASIVAQFASSVRHGYAGAAQSGGDADSGGNGAVDASLAAVREHGSARQGFNRQVEGAHGVRGPQHEGPASRRGDGARQREHGAPRPRGQESVDAQACLVGGGVHAGGPLGATGRPQGRGQGGTTTEALPEMSTQGAWASTTTTRTSGRASSAWMGRDRVGLPVTTTVSTSPARGEETMACS